jgi:outer membrane receptor protein involved in Fe transport
LARNPLNAVEVRIYGAEAELTGNVVPLRGFMGRLNLARSLTDLARRHRRLGDGTFYLIEGIWPPGKISLDLSQPYFESMTAAVEQTRLERRRR